MKKILGIILAIVLSSGFSVLKAEEITIVTTADFPPYNYTQNGRPAGFSTEIAEFVVKEAKLTGIVQVSSWARAYNTALEKENVLIPLNRTRKREYFFKWLGPITKKKVYFYKLRDRKDIAINSLYDALQPSDFQ